MSTKIDAGENVNLDEFKHAGKPSEAGAAYANNVGVITAASLREDDKDFAEWATKSEAGSAAPSENSFVKNTG